MKRTTIEISWNTFWQVLVFLGIVLLFYVSREALGILFAGIVISLGLDPFVSFLEERGVNRLLGGLLTFILGTILLGAGIYLIIPVIAVEMGAFISQINSVLTETIGAGIPSEAINNMTSNFNEIVTLFASSNISVTGTISAVFEKIVFAVATIIISFYLLIEKNGTERLMKVALPKIYEKSVLTVFSRFKNKMRLWIVTQLGLSLVVGSIVTLGLWLLGVRYALILGVIAAVLELVPVIGPIISGAIAFLIASSESFVLGIYVVIFFFLVQQFENNVLIPVLMKRAMRIHPVIALTALIAGGNAAGFVGIILAIPIALLVQETFNYVAEQKDSREKAELGI